MTTSIYIDPSAATNGTGTAASPYNTWTGVPVGAGYLYYQKRNTSWAGTFPSLTAGTSGNVTTVSAYYNADGSDDATQAKPIINVGDTQFQGAKDFCKWSNLDLRSSRSVAANDTPVLFIGNDCEVSNCAITGNLSGIGGSGVSRAVIKNNTITAATTASSVSMYGVFLTGTANTDANQITGNVIKIGTGGANTSGIRCSADAPGNQTNLLIKSNTVTTVSGVVTANTFCPGVWLYGATSPEISYNTVTYMSHGVYVDSVAPTASPWVHHNTCNYNSTAGINASALATKMLCEWNVCRHNGSSVSPYTGRGIVVSSSSNILRFNDCSYSVNYGNAADDGSEGVGILMQLGGTANIVYGNMLYANEGTGLKIVGDNTLSDNGGHFITGNYFINNGLSAWKNRRSGTKYVSQYACHVYLNNVYGTKTAITNNLFAGGLGGICELATCSNVDKADNVFQDETSYAMAGSGASYARASNAAYYDYMGILRQAAPFSQRYNYNPANLSAGASWLYEGNGATNLLLYSQTFDYSYWTKAGATCVANSAVSPEGSATADFIKEDTSNGQHQVKATVALGVGVYTFSVYAKGTRNLSLFPQGAGLSASSVFSLVGAGSVLASFGGQFISNSISSVGNGWYRCSVTFNSATAVNATMVAYLSTSSANSPIYTGDGASGVYLWGAQLETGSVATSYIPTHSKFISRASTKTYFDKYGVMQTAGADMAAYEYDPNTLRYENMLLWSSAFDNGAWSKDRTAVDTTNTIIAPDGTLAGMKVSDSLAGSNSYRVYENVTVSNGTTYTFSVYAKQGAYNWCYLRIGTSLRAWFNLATGVVGTVDAGVVSTSITPVGNGWYRIAMAVTQTATSSFGLIGLCNANSVETYTPSTGGNIYIWGAQLNSGSTALEYRRTTSIAQPKQYAEKGLSVEGAGVNLVWPSSDVSHANWTKAKGGVGVAPVVTINFATAPDGSTTACRVQLDRGAGTTTGDYSLAYQSPVITGASGTLYTGSVWLKSNTGVNQNVVVYGATIGKVVAVTQQWQRVTLSDATNSLNGNGSFVVGTRGGTGSFFSGGDSSLDILMWGEQIETGSIATSYIPTTSAAATRSADIVTSMPAARAADISNIRNNVFKSNIPKPVGDLSVDANGVPTPNLLYTTVQGDRVADPLLDGTTYIPQAGSPLLDPTWREGLNWPSVPVAKSDI